MTHPQCCELHLLKGRLVVARMKGSHEAGAEKQLGIADGACNEAIKCELNHTRAAESSKVICIQSSSEESDTGSARAKPSELKTTTTTQQQSKPRKRQQSKKASAFSSGTEGKKPATAPVFKADKNDPFGISQTSVDFVIRGKPRPQYRDKPGWNGTRYNPSKSLQKQFGHVAIEQCLNHANTVPDFGPDVGIRMEIHFRFPPPKAGRIKNTADIDNLSKFALDACNTIFYGDDGQVLCLCADKDYDGAYGGEGYTSMKIEIVSTCSG